MADVYPKPHLTTYEGRWVIMWHRKSPHFIWSTPKDFADAIRYLKASDGPRLAHLTRPEIFSAAIASR